MRKLITVLICSALMSGLCHAETDPSPKREKNQKLVTGLNDKWRKLAEKSEDILALPALIADRKEKKVTFLAEATDISAGDLIEFFVIGEASGHDYEALTRSFATAGDIKKALEFIGMEPGYPVDFSKHRFWPKGERVRMYVALHGNQKKLIPVEHYIMDDRTGKPLPDVGFAFTGSAMTENADGEMVLAADAREPQSIASNYNEPETLLDIPYQGNQDELYDHLHTYAEMHLPAHELVHIILEPEHKDDTKRICDLTLKAQAPEKAADSITNYIFAVTDSEGTLLNESKDLKSSIELFAEKNEADKDVFLSLSISENVPVKHAAQISQVIQSLESQGSIRVAPPPEGQLYYRAFIPNRAHLDRQARAGHPWELRLNMDKDSMAGTLTRCEFVWEDDIQNPKVVATDHDVTSPDAVRKIVIETNDKLKAKDKQPNIPVVLLVASPDMTFGQIRDFVMPLHDVLPIVHIYSGE